MKAGWWVWSRRRESAESFPRTLHLVSSEWVVKVSRSMRAIRVLLLQLLTWQSLRAWCSQRCAWCIAVHAHAAGSGPFRRHATCCVWVSVSARRFHWMYAVMRLRLIFTFHNSLFELGLAVRFACKYPFLLKSWPDFTQSSALWVFSTAVNCINQSIVWVGQVCVLYCWCCCVRLGWRVAYRILYIIIARRPKKFTLNWQDVCKGIRHQYNPIPKFLN